MGWNILVGLFVVDWDCLDTGQYLHTCESECEHVSELDVRGGDRYGEHLGCALQLRYLCCAPRVRSGSGRGIRDVMHHFTYSSHTLLHRLAGCQSVDPIGETRAYSL
jgi:hypothetical protein